MANKKIQRIKTISEYHKFRNLPKPLHPLISLVDYSLIQHTSDTNDLNWIQEFYTIGLKRDVQGKFRYGQKQYDFDEGLMSFIAPNQVFGVEVFDYKNAPSPTGWLLFIHPDFLWNSPLAKTIKCFEFFGYNVNESLFLSEKEEKIIVEILRNIEQEYHQNIDAFSQRIIISYLDTLLTYAERFYQRQFITRKISNHQILESLEEVLVNFFNDKALMSKGVPTVSYIAGRLNVSPNYLSGLLKTHTGKSTQQHIHDKIIEKAKEKLTTTGLSVSEIAYDLGFEYPQSFSKLFKQKTDFSPLEFRQSFN
ncbi:helix-turn-helix domain-containing protein [uncultured Algoriphagus sp.]|uniref:helix-turn-helix domain-containing protein n=1 Tax=uncultured Algoriphagus sp. TaxID=417365 RepID=UPI0030ED1554|tara:strand:+ start:67954 stop:68877 length:924 start_codon:yes stop_codon:yes gene_type:complete